MPISTLSLSGFLLIASIKRIKIFPPSRAGNGNKFVIPNDNEINAIKYIKSANPLVDATVLEIPIGPIIWSTDTLPINIVLTLSANDITKFPVSNHA